MITAILIIMLLLIMAILGFLYVIHIHLTIKKEFKKNDWMDNSEYDYGHDVRHNNSDF